MPEEQGDIVPVSSSELSPSSGTNSDPNTILAKVEERLATANTPEEIVLWTQIRGEIIRQDELRKDAEQKRTIETIEVVSQKGLTAAALGIGVGLIIIGIPEIGLLVLGAGLYKLAPDFVKKAFSGKN
jgi:hypothetical protein